MKNTKIIGYITVLCSMVGLNILTYSLTQKNISKNVELENNNQITHVTNYVKKSSFSATAQIDAKDVIIGATSGKLDITLTMDPEGENNTFSIDKADPDDKDFSNILDPVFKSSICVDGVNYNFTSIGEYAFSASVIIEDYIPINERLIGTLTLPNTLKWIGESAFSQNKNISSIIFGNSLESIGRRGFYLCTSLTGVLSFPNTLKNIGDQGFYSDPITNVEINDNPNFHDIVVGNGHVISTSEEWDHTTPIGCLAWGDFNNLSWLDGETIMPSIFQGCGGITSVTLPDSIDQIQSTSFFYCSSLQNINLDKIRIIGDNSFNYSQIKKIKLSPTVTITNLDNARFYSCPIISVDINNNPNFHDIAVGNGHVISTSEEWDHTTLVGSLAWGDFNDLLWLDGETTMPSIFQECGGITSVTLPDSITTIDKSAFYGCSRLSWINLENITSIYTSAFQDCTRLTGTLDIPKNCLSIGNNAFMRANYNQINLNWEKGVNLENIRPCWLGNLNNPNTIINVPDDMLSFYIENAKTLGIDLCKIVVETWSVNLSLWISGEDVKGSMIIKLESSPIFNKLSCYILALGDNINVINPVINSKLEIDFNAKFTINEITNNFFKDQLGLRGSLTIDAGITTIGSDIFIGCKNISEIRLNWTKEEIESLTTEQPLLHISSDWLKSLNRNGFKIIVPKNAIDTYKANIDLLGINNCSIVEGSDPTPLKPNKDDYFPLYLGTSLGVGISILVATMTGITIGIKKHHTKSNKKKCK